MTDLKMFKRDGRGCEVEVRGSRAPLEAQLQRRVEAGMQEMLGVRLLASEYPTGWHGGRIDSLGLDENNVPVIIEYKKGAGHGALSQVLSYLGWLVNSRHEVEALVAARLGPEVARQVDWRAPRMVCIAADFTQHDRHAVHQLGQRVDLIRYRIFEDSLLALQLLESSRPASSSHRRPRPQPDEATQVSEPPGASGPSVEVEVPDCLRDLFEELDGLLTEQGSVEVEHRQQYVAYRALTNIASVVFRPRRGSLLLYLKLDPQQVALEEGFSRDVRGVGHWGTGDLEVRISSPADLERVAPLIRRAFATA